MIDKTKIAQYNLEVAEHANGAAQYFRTLIGGRFVTREEAQYIVDFVLVQTKRNIESCHLVCQEEKDAEIRRRGYMMKDFIGR